MRELIIAVLTSVTATVSAQVQVPRTMLCDDRDQMFRQVFEEFQEEPVWTGSSATHETRLTLTVKKDTGEWTLLEFNNHIACILAVGDKSKLILGKTI